MSQILQTDFTDLRQSRLGAITGGIWFVLDGQPFPEAGWSDFPVIVLAWWIAEVQRIRARVVDQVEFSFMDGPFVVMAKANADASVHLQGWRSGAKSDLLLGEDDVVASELMGEILSASASVLRRCEDLGLSSADLDRLAASLHTELSPDER